MSYSFESTPRIDESSFDKKVEYVLDQDSNGNPIMIDNLPVLVSLRYSKNYEEWLMEVIGRPDSPWPLRTLPWSRCKSVGECVLEMTDMLRRHYNVNSVRLENWRPAAQGGSKTPTSGQQ